MATTLEIVRGISQAAANAYDGSQDSKYSFDGEERKIGLKREEGDSINDSRVIDGFSVKFEGNLLCISYQSDIRLKDVYAGDIEADVEDMIQNVASFLKKEYKKITGDKLSLTPEGDVSIAVQNTSRVRVFVNGYRYYKIGGMDDVLSAKDASEDRLDKSIKDFIALGKNG